MIWLAIPIGGVLAYLIFAGGSKPVYQTPPPGPFVPPGQPSSARADTYLNRITEAMNVFRASTIIPGVKEAALFVLRSTFDVVSVMAEADGKAGLISTGDLQKIRDRITSFKKEAGV